MEPPDHSYKPANGAVRSIMSEQLLQQQLPESPHFQGLNALPKKFAAIRGSKHEGKIRVNKEVLAVLKQVSAELDTAQRHYLAFKQYGEAGESLLSLARDMINLPTGEGGLAATASQADVAAGEAAGPGEGEQDGAAVGHVTRSSRDSITGAATAPRDLLVGHRRWGHFPMLQHLRATSAKHMQAPVAAAPLAARWSADEVPPVAADIPAGAADLVPDSPKMSWGALMRQKKAEKEQGIARLVRVKHAVLVIQRAWRACLNKRASRALAMMVLRAKVRRAHRAAYVSNLLRKKPRAAAGPNARTSSDRGIDDADAAGLPDPGGCDPEDDAEVVVVDEHGQVVLTQQQEAEFELQLAQVLEAAQGAAGRKKAELPLKLAHLAELLPPGSDGSSSQGEEEDEEEEEEEQAPVWKVISTPKAGPKWPAGLRVETRVTGGPNWQMGLRTPRTAITPHRIGSPDSPASQHSSRSFKQSRSVKSRPSTSDASSRPGSRGQGRLLPAKLAAGAGAAEGAGVGGADAGAEQGKSGHRGAHRTGAAVSFAVIWGEASETGDLLGEPEASDAAAGDGERAWSGGSASTGAAGGDSSRAAARGGVRVGHKGVGIVAAAATHAVAVVRADGEVVIRARSASKKLLKSARKFSTAAAAAAAAAAGQDSACAADTGTDTSRRQQQLPGEPAEHAGSSQGAGDHQQAWKEEACCFEPGQDSSSVVASCGTSGSQGPGWPAAGGVAGDPLPASTTAEMTAAATERLSADGGGTGTGSGSCSTAAAMSTGPGSRRVTGPDKQDPVRSRPGTSAGIAGAAAGEQQGPGDSRRSTKEGGPAGCGGGSSRASTPPSNRGFFAGSSGNAAFNKYERGLGDGLQQDFRVLQADAVTAGSRAPTPPQTSHGHRASTPSRRLSSCEVQTPPHAPGASSGRSSPQQGNRQQLQQHAAEEGPDLLERHGQRQLQQQSAQGAGGTAQLPQALLPAAQQQEQQQQQQQGVGEASFSVDPCSRAASRVTAEGQSSGRNPVSSTAGQLQLSTSSRERAAGAAVAASPAIAGATCCTPLEDARQAGPLFLQVASFRQAQQASSVDSVHDAACAALPDSAAAGGASLGMQEYAAQVAAYRAAGLADPSALGGVVLGADGSLRLVQEQAAGAGRPQQQQQVPKADEWFRRLQKARARGAAAAAGAGRRGTWEAAYVGTSSVQQQSWQEGGGQFGQRSSSVQLAEQQLPAVQSGLGADPSKLTGWVGPVGVWGRRATVHDAWLHVDGRSTAALPWQALAAITVAGDSGASSSGDAPGALQGGGGADAAAAAAAGSGLAQLSVRGRQLLVRMMWLKSAAGVVRGGGGDAVFLEGRLLRLLQQNTAPAGLELLLWSVEDEQQQQQQQQQQIQAQQHARHQEQQQQAWGVAACSAPSTAAAAAAAAAGGYGAPQDVSLVGGGIGTGGTGVWRQTSTPERVLEPYLQLHGPLTQASSSSSGAVPLPRKGGASMGAPGGLRRLHGEHLPLLPAVRCAPLTGPHRRSTQQQQQQQQPGQALVLAQQLGLGSQVQPQGQQQQQQQRRWHCTVDDLALRAMHEQQQQQQRFAATASSSESQPMWVQRKAILRRTTAEVHAPCSSTPQWMGPVYGGMPQGALVGQGTAQPEAGSAVPSSTARALWQQQQQQQQQQHNPAAAAAVFSSQPGLFLAVNGEGGLALPAHRQSSLPHGMPPLQEPLTQRQRQTPADPSSQLWLIPELQRLQLTNIAGASQAPVSFVNTKPQQRRQTRQQQQQQQQQPLHDAFCIEQQQVQQQQQHFAVCGGSGDEGRSVQGVGLAGAPGSSSWGQFSHPSQWYSRCGRPGVLLPQLPARSLRPRQHQQQLLLSADAVPWAGIQPARRLSSSDPGSAALRQAVAGARAMVAGAVLSPAAASHSGSGHAAVVELPQLAVLRVADAVQ